MRGRHKPGLACPPRGTGSELYGFFVVFISSLHRVYFPFGVWYGDDGLFDGRSSGSKGGGGRPSEANSVTWTSKSWPFLVQVSYCLFIARLFFGAAAVVANSEERSGDDGLLAGGGRALGAARGAGCAAGALGSCREGLNNWAGVSGPAGLRRPARSATRRPGSSNSGGWAAAAYRRGGGLGSGAEQHPRGPRGLRVGAAGSRPVALGSE